MPQYLLFLLMAFAAIGVIVTLLSLAVWIEPVSESNPTLKWVSVILLVFIVSSLVLTWGASSFSGAIGQKYKVVSNEDYRYKYVPNGLYLGISFSGEDINSKDEIIKELEQKGLFGRHTLKMQFHNPGVSGDFQANFLSGTSGTVKTRGKLQFAWPPEGSDGVMYTNSFPARKIKFVKVDESAKPTIRFKFNLNSTELEEKMKEKGTNLGELIDERWIDYMVVRRPSDLKIPDLFRL